MSKIISNSLSFHLTTASTPTPSSWVNLLLDIISSQFYDGITWNDVMKKLKLMSQSNRSSYNENTINYCPSSLAHTIQIPNITTNIPLQKYLFSLLIHLSATDPITHNFVTSVSNSKSSSSSSSSSTTSTTNNTTAMETPISIYDTHGRSLSMESLTMQDCTDHHYLFRASLQRRVVAMSSSGTFQKIEKLKT